MDYSQFTSEQLIEMVQKMQYDNRHYKNEEKAREKLFQILYQEKMRLELQQNISKDKPLQDLYNEVKELRGKTLSDGRIPDYVFITVSPPSHITLEELIKMAQDLHKKKWMLNYLYVIEQRGTTEDDCGKGFHYHSIIFREEKKWCHFLREIKSTISRLGNTEDSRYFDLQYIRDEADLSRRVKYITSDKKCTEQNDKQKKQIMDKTFRLNNNIEPYYLQGEKLKSYLIIEDGQETI